MGGLDGRGVRHKKTRITFYILGVMLQLLRLIVVVEVMGLLLRGTTPQMVLSRVQHAAAQSVQLGQRPRTHLEPHGILHIFQLPSEQFIIRNVFNIEVF